MLFGSPKLDEMPKALRLSIEHFCEKTDEYRKAQTAFLESESETKRLIAAAEALEAEAEEKKREWHELALQSVPQKQISAAIDKSVKLQDEANILRKTAEARASLKDEFLMKLAEMRFDLKGKDSALNNSYSEWLISEAMSDPNWKEPLGVIFNNFKSVYSERNRREEPYVQAQSKVTFTNASRYSDQFLAEFAIKILGQIKDENCQSPTVLLPEPVAGEIVVGTFVAMRKLKSAPSLHPSTIKALHTELRVCGG